MIRMLLAVVAFGYLLFQASATPGEVKYLQQGEHFKYKSASNARVSEFRIFCYKGKPKYLVHLWQTVALQLDHPNNEFTIYDGPSPAQVQRDYDGNKFAWNLNYLFAWKQRQMKLDPFNQSCVGIESKQDYSVVLNVIRIDYWKVLLLILGLFLFFSADKLSRNVFFFYLIGVTLGICTSFLILIYFFSKLFPKKPVMYGVAACGWTVGIYILQLLWDNIRVILSNYMNYLVWYAVVTGIMSFIICYKWGPLENEKNRNLLRWGMQSMGLAAIYFSTSFQEAAMGQIVVLLLFYNIPSSWLTMSKKYWKKKFPPKVKMLTDDEYYQQGVKETEKALSQLKEYCSSPECNQWNVALKLKDVKRFASFIEGNSHLSDEEILEYETSINATDLTDVEEYTEDEEDD